MKIQKRKIVFAAALGLLILSIIYRLMNPYVQPRVTRLTHTGNGKETYKIGEEKGSLEKSVKPSDATREEPKTSRRVYKDLFFIYKPPQRVERDNTASPPSPPSGETIETVTAIREYIASYKFYGTYTSGEQKAVFLAKDKLVLVGRTGDRIDGKYLIDDIQDTVIRFKALELNETIDINIREFNND